MESKKKNYLKNSLKIGNLKVQNLLNTVDEWKFLSQVITVFAWSTKTLMFFWSTNSRQMFSPQLLLSVGLTGSSTCLNQSFTFLKELIVEDPLSPIIYTASTSFNEDQFLIVLVMAHFAIFFFVFYILKYALGIIVWQRESGETNTHTHVYLSFLVKLE